jgi:hypothetical protein
MIEIPRLLECSPSCRDGCTEATLLMHGFTVEQRVDPDPRRVATAHAQRMRACLSLT